ILQRGFEKSGHGPTVIRPHAAAKSVENAHDPDVDAVFAVIGEGERLGEAPGFVVYAPRTDRVDVAPVGLRLGIDQWVAVHLRRGGEKEDRSFVSGQTETLVGAEGTDLQGVDGPLEVVDGRRRRGEVEDVVDVT